MDEDTTNNSTELENEYEPEPWEPGLGDIAFEAIAYLRTGKGHEALMAWLLANQAAKKAEAEFHQERLKAQIALANRNTTAQAWLYGLALVLLVGSLLYLSQTDKLTPASGTILGALAGYILGGRSLRQPTGS